MSKRDKIIYWVATIWLSLGMLSTGIVQLLKTEDEVNKINSTTIFRDEMVAAFRWAQKNNVRVYHFDINSGGLKEGVTGKEPENTGNPISTSRKLLFSLGGLALAAGLAFSISKRKGRSKQA